MIHMGTLRQYVDQYKDLDDGYLKLRLKLHLPIEELAAICYCLHKRENPN